MQVEIAIEYRDKETKQEISPISRKEKIKVRIPEVPNNEAPLAFIIHNSKDRPMKIRMFKNQLYKEARISYYNGKKTEEYPIDEIPWGRVLQKYSPFGSCASKGEYVACLKVAIREYLIIGNALFRRCNEPYYHLVHFGYPNFRTAVFIEFSDKSKKIMPGYSALDKETAINDAISMSGNSENVIDKEKLSQGHIEVVMPAACKRKYKRQVKAVRFICKSK